MLTLTPARIRWRTRRTLLAAALTAAAAVPATADAATVTTSGTKNGTILQYRATPGELNDVRVSLPGARIVISDQVPITASGTCVLNAAGDAECANVDLVRLEPGRVSRVLEARILSWGEEVSLRCLPRRSTRTSCENARSGSSPRVAARSRMSRTISACTVRRSVSGCAKPRPMPARARIASPATSASASRAWSARCATYVGRTRY